MPILVPDDSTPDSSYASPEDVEARWQTLTEQQKALAAVLLADAEAILRLRVPQLAERIAAGTLDITVVRGVLVRMVMRVMRNPDGKVSETIDDYTYRRADAVADGSLYLSVDDLALLQPAVASRGAFTIRAVPEPAWVPDVRRGW